MGKQGFPIDCVVPAPPSMNRASQPVVELAKELANRIKVPAFEGALAKTKQTQSTKNIPDWWERQRILKNAMQSGKASVVGKSVLILDDLVESGSTLRRAAEVLLNDAKAAKVYALAR